MNELKNITPTKFQTCFKHYPEPCCTAVFKDNKGNLFIIGKKINKNKFYELKNRVGKGETVVMVPAGLVVNVK
jgi:hypothetical protein